MNTLSIQGIKFERVALSFENGSKFLRAYQLTSGVQFNL